MYIVKYIQSISHLRGPGKHSGYTPRHHPNILSLAKVNSSVLLDTDSISPTRLVHFRSSLGLGLGQQLAHLLAKVEVGRSSDGGIASKLVRAMRNPPLLTRTI